MISPAATAYADQFEAAARDARIALVKIAARASDPARPAGAMHRLVDTVRQQGLRGDLVTCGHINPLAPQVAHYLGWHPGRIWCAICVCQLAAQVRGTEEDHRCDACGVAGDHVTPSIAAVGAVLISAAFCTTCRERA